MLVATVCFGFTGLVGANFMPMQTPQPAIVIKSDGTVDPATSLIQRDGNVYTLTRDIVGYTIAVEADNVTIDGDGYTLQGEDNSVGVFVQQRTVTIQNMSISGFHYGILFTWYGMGTTNNSIVVANSTITDNHIGISVEDYSKNSTISGNTVENNTYGICLKASGGSILRNNSMNNNVYNFFVSATTLESASNDIDTSNTVDGKPIIYWVDQHDKVVPFGAGYIGLVDCTNITVKDYELKNNGQAILLVSVTDSIVTKNRISNNQNGIWLAQSNNNTLSENTFTDNTYDTLYVVSSNSNNIVSNTMTGNGHNGTEFAQVLGYVGKGAIRFTMCANNNISCNTITDNGEGINLGDSTNNLIYENTFTNNNGTAVLLFESSQNNITCNVIKENNGWGVKLWFTSSNNIVYSNVIEKNSNGISIDDASQNTVIYNNSTQNSGWGIQIESSITSGDLGYTGNLIHHNNFADNQADGLEVSIPGIWGMDGWVSGLSNFWDDGKEGNYWGDYTTRYTNATKDSNIWDTPYTINENNIDHYPLAAPSSIEVLPEFPTLTLLFCMLGFVVIVLVGYRKKLQKNGFMT
jgi:parallel beta-helix repeat protein